MAVTVASTAGDGTGFLDATNLVLGAAGNQRPAIKVHGVANSGVKFGGPMTNQQTFKLINTGSNSIKVYPPANAGSDVWDEINNLGVGVGYDLAGGAIVDVIFDGAGGSKNIWIG